MLIGKEQKKHIGGFRVELVNLQVLIDSNKIHVKKRAENIRPNNFDIVYKDVVTVSLMKDHEDEVKDKTNQVIKKIY